MTTMMNVSKISEIDVLHYVFYYVLYYVMYYLLYVGVILASSLVSFAVHWDCFAV
jgi:hypothetical protein